MQMHLEPTLIQMLLMPARFGLLLALCLCCFVMQTVVPWAWQKAFTLPAVTQCFLVLHHAEAL